MVLFVFMNNTQEKIGSDEKIDYNNEIHNMDSNNTGDSNDIFKYRHVDEIYGSDEPSDKTYTSSLINLILDIKDFPTGELYKPISSNEQLYAIINDDMGKYKLINMFSWMMNSIRDIKEVVSSINSATMDDVFVKQTKPKLMKRNYDGFFDMLDAYVGIYLFTYDYSTKKLLSDKILIISPPEFFKAIKKRYEVDTMEHWNPLKNFPPDDKYDIIFIFELEFHMDLYKFILELRNDDCIFISKYFGASDDYDIMISDIYQKLYNIPKQRSLHFYPAETIRNKYLKNMKYIAGKKQAEEGYTIYPISLLFIGIMSDDIYPKKMNMDFFDSSQLTGDDLNMSMKDMFDYVHNDSFLYSVYAMHLYDMCGMKPEDVNRLDDIYNKVSDEYLTDVYTHLTNRSKMLSEDIPSYELIKKPFVMERYNRIIYYMSFDVDMISYIRKKEGHIIIYTIDYKIDGFRNYVMAHLYYHMLGVKYNKSIHRYSNIVEQARPDIRSSNIFMLNRDMGAKYSQSRLYTTVYMYHSNKAVLERFPNSHGLSNAYLKDKEIFNQYFTAYIKRTGLDDININYIKTLASMGSSDAEMLEYIASNVPAPPKLSYEKQANIISKQIKRVLREFNTKGHISSYLDIGSIDDKQIEIIAESFNIKPENAYGINIDEEQEGHLNYNYEATKDKIVIYDGQNIPVINNNHSYDLISIFSVLHHIPHDILQELAKSIYNRCNKYLVIKDNDLTDDITITYFLWQHYIYDRNLSLEGYTRTDLTLQKVIDLFEGVGFEYIGADLNEVFVRRYFALFKKR